MMKSGTHWDNTPFETLPDHMTVMNEKARVIYQQLLRCSSETRVGALLHLIRRTDSETFWQVFQESWNVCDDTWPYKNWLLGYLRYHSHLAPARQFMNDADGTFYDALANRIQIFRGCSVGPRRQGKWFLIPLLLKVFLRAV
jgi:hypothetical protein